MPQKNVTITVEYVTDKAEAFIDENNEVGIRAIYLTLGGSQSDDDTVTTKKITSSVMADYDSDGVLIGIEIIGSCEHEDIHGLIVERMMDLANLVSRNASKNSKRIQ